MDADCNKQKKIYIMKRLQEVKRVSVLLLKKITEADIEKGLYAGVIALRALGTCPSGTEDHRLVLCAQQWASGWRLLSERRENKVGKSERFPVSCGCSLTCQRWEEEREWSSIMGGTVHKRVKGRTQGAPSSTQETETDS